MARAVFTALTVLPLVAWGVAPRPIAAEEARTDLTAAARVGARPLECGGTERSGASRWELARQPGLGKYCRALALGYASLGHAPDAALAAASAAEAALPGHAAPWVLTARVHAAAQDCVRSWSAFERARALAPKSVEVPSALHDFAVCAMRTEHRSEALAAYRVLVPRVEIAFSGPEGLDVLIEAAVLSMSLGKEQLPEAIGYLTEARRRTVIPGFGDVVSAALALALDRAGRSSEAAGLVAETPGPWRLEGERDRMAKGEPSILPALPKGELDAMIAMLAGPRDRELSLDRWQSYLDEQKDGATPFVAHARARREAIASRKGAR